MKVDIPRNTFQPKLIGQKISFEVRWKNRVHPPRLLAEGIFIDKQFQSKDVFPKTPEKRSDFFDFKNLFNSQYCELLQAIKINFFSQPIQRCL